MLTFDNSAAMMALDELDQLISDMQLAPDVRNAILNLLDGPSQLLRIVPNVSGAPVGGTVETAICFEPSERLGNLLATLRAGDVDRLLVEHG